TLPAPHEADLPNYYPRAYYGKERRFVGVVDRMLDAVNQRKAARLARIHGTEPARVLEIGCGHGLLLDQLRRRGWTVTGTELSTASSGYARDVLGIDVRVGDLLSMRFADASFDVVILWHSLEHVRDPFEHVREVSRILRPGGLL